MSTAPNSSLIITAGSLLSNRTYQFMVRMENRQISSIQVTGFVLVNVVDTRSPVIAVAIIWNIYQGTILSSNIIQWKMLNEINTYENIWFYGRYTKNFTATKQLLIQYPHIEYWRFEVIYSFFSETGSSSLNFLINHPPKNGSCSASPLN
ncbi:unnamed protein product [Rotaria sp. Silwood1]|nr:unnamed protein product [Rotaria sp. Silwood1]